MLNARGGIECDFTVTRLAEDRFRIVTGTAFGQHDLAWLLQRRSPRRVGARRGRTLRRSTPATASGDRMPVRFSSRSRLPISRTSPSGTCVRTSWRSGACRVWLFASRTWASWAGAVLPLRVRARALGYDLGGGPRATPRRGRLQGDRLAAAENGPRWGSDITPEDTPFEAGLGFAVSSTRAISSAADALVGSASAGTALPCLPGRSTRHRARL